MVRGQVRQTPSLDHLNWYLLPTQIRDIAEVCGKDVAALLLEHFDGRRIRVPIASHLQGHAITEAIGHDCAARLAYHYGGQFIQVPRAYHAFLKLRNDTLRNERLESR